MYYEANVNKTSKFDSSIIITITKFIEAIKDGNDTQLLIKTTGDQAFSVANVLLCLGFVDITGDYEDVDYDSIEGIAINVDNQSELSFISDIKEAYDYNYDVVIYDISKPQIAFLLKDEDDDFESENEDNLLSVIVEDLICEMMKLENRLSQLENKGD